MQICDLASLAAIRALAEEWLAGGQPLDVLVNNAGHMLHERTPSADGYESNVSPFCCCACLLPQGCQQQQLHCRGVAAPSASVICTVVNRWCLPALPGGVQFAVNTLASFALTAALEPALHAAAGGARVVFVASGGQVAQRRGPAAPLLPGFLALLFRLLSTCTVALPSCSATSSCTALASFAVQRAPGDRRLAGGAAEKV